MTQITFYRNLGLHTLRSNLTVIPQDPTLFAGPVRSNVDPTGQHDDKDIWQVLDQSQVAVNYSIELPSCLPLNSFLLCSDEVCGIFAGGRA